MTGSEWALYEYQPSFILGFHGCDEETGEAILRQTGLHLNQSEKEHDWLGHGIYFWEGNPRRAFEWAEQRKADGKIKKSFVLGAILDLRHCLDLFDSNSLAQLTQAHASLKALMASSGEEMPRNVGATPDKAGRKLDCAVVNALHGLRSKSGLPEYDSIRGPFLEGSPVYEGAGFRAQNHIQICVRTTACIKGYFRPILNKL
ncbi:hypothetical protein [Noviherbaspirillum malthae]|jgi:hypothetical protein|uniref:hypothetical protein n=1 Tax=Noviherbaspirillum malthae TaxID=1260987 RepID=UPI00188F28BB|nr:hypothetical protein [Noviherbaspirillum malthae]